MSSATAYPLTWPQQFPRRDKFKRENGQFKTELAKAIKNVQTSLKLFAENSGKKIEGLVISSNVTLGINSPEDPAVAVWFTWDDLQVCIPVDRYNSVASNLQAIHMIIEARRVELRHGTLALVRATFHGFKALPAPAKDAWRVVLGLQPGERDLAKIRDTYRKLRSEVHPDKKQGDHSEFNRVQLAWEQAQAELQQ